MCGIAAIISKEGMSFDFRSIMKKKLSLIEHRGPDDGGVVCFDDQKNIEIYGLECTPEEVYQSNFNYCPVLKEGRTKSKKTSVVLGHRRLSIIDLSPGGHQPMSTPDQRYWITYNGEIYNYLEIKEELQKLGIIFKTASDTEVILHAYRVWGTDCLNHFNGMFAFIIFDRLEETFFIVRDRFGVKPLYYWESPAGFIAFASEIKQFTAFPQWRARVNFQRAYDFLNWSLTDHTEETMFNEVMQVPPGHYIKMAINSLKLNPKKWYSPSLSVFEGSYERATSKFHDLFYDAVKLRLRADVTIGSCLSGGIDSSSIVCIIHNILNKSGSKHFQKTFSACSTEEKYCEKKYIDFVTHQCKLNAYYTYPEMDALLTHLPQIVWQQDEPFISTSIFAQWSVFGLAKDKQVKVALDGQGADEQLCGYFSFFGYRYKELFQNLKWIKLLNEMKYAQKVHRKHYGLTILLNHLLPACIKKALLKYLNRPTENPSWMNFDRSNIIKQFPIKPRPTDIKTFSLEQIFYTNLPMLLRYEDRNSMHHSIEARTPFLDYRLVEHCLSLPSGYKIEGHWTKKILRTAMKEYLPKEIYQRTDKIGFVTAEEVWIKKHASLFKKLIAQSIDNSAGLFNAHAMDHFDKMVAGKIAFDYLPWRIICFGKWMEIYGVQ